MGKTIILVHGRSFKPAKGPLEQLWREALAWGIERDFPTQKPALDAATISFVYYGDISNKFLTKATGKPAPGAADLKSRRVTLERLKKLKKSEFSKANYNALPGKESFKEGVADSLSPILSFFHLSDALIEAVAPDMREYWNEDGEFGTDVRYPLIAPLKGAMDRGDQICLIGHSLGTMVAYDTLWKFSHTGEYRPNYTDKKVDLFITLGSPLADETVKRKLKGAGSDGPRRYPANIRKWVNVAAEDDFICHDEEVADDYKPMRQAKLVRSIIDEPIYNLSVRDGKSNPHHEGGYLIHPTVARHVAAWLK